MGSWAAGTSVLQGLRAEDVELPLEHVAEGSTDSVTATSMVVVAKGVATTSTHTLVHSPGVTAAEPLLPEVWPSCLCSCRLCTGLY